MMTTIAILIVLLNIAWLALTVLGMPGNWLMITSAGVFTWLFWQPDATWSDQPFHITTFIILIALALFAELIEFALSAVGARKAGASKRSALLALFFSLVGAIIATFIIPIPVVGTIIGACLGAFLGACLGEMSLGKEMNDTIKIGTAAAVGRLLGTIAKISVGVTIFLIIALALFWP